MSDVIIEEGGSVSGVDELATLMCAPHFTQIQYDKVCRFMIYFSIAESKFAPMRDGLRGTDTLAHDLVSNGCVDHQVIEDSYLYFIERYRDNAQSANRFNKLVPDQFIGPALKARFVSLLHVQAPTLEEKVSLVYKVIFRLRHNLFHGEKWSYNLKGQDGNFSHAVNVLLSCLTLSRQVMWHP